MIPKFRIPIPKKDFEKTQLLQFINNNLKHHIWYSLNQIYADKDQSKEYVYVYLIGTMLEENKTVPRYALKHNAPASYKLNWVTVLPKYKEPKLNCLNIDITTPVTIDCFLYTKESESLDFQMNVQNPRSLCKPQKESSKETKIISILSKLKFW